MKTKRESFGDYTYPGHAITLKTINGITYSARIEYDHDSTPRDFDCYSVRKINDWKNDEWFFCGVVITATHQKTGVILDDCAASLWCIEANFNKRANRYLDQVAYDQLLPEAQQTAEALLKELAQCAQ